MGTQSWGKDTPRHQPHTRRGWAQHKTSDKEWGAQGGSECPASPEFSFIDQSLQYQSGLTLFMSVLVRIIRSDVMTHYDFRGGAVHAQVKQIKGQPGPGNKDFAHGRIKDTEHQTNANIPAPLTLYSNPHSVFWCHKTVTPARLTPGMPGSSDCYGSYFSGNRVDLQCFTPISKCGCW